MYVFGSYRSYASFLAVLLLQLRQIYTWRSYDVDLVGFEYEVCDHAYFKQCDWRLKPYKGHNVLNGSFTFTQDMDDLVLQSRITATRPHNEETVLLDVTVNACQLLIQKNLNLMRIMLLLFRKTNHGYFPDSCPIQGNRPMVLNALYVDPELFPPYAPNLLFTSKFNLLVDNKYILKSVLNGTVFTKKKKKKSDKANKNYKKIGSRK